MHAPIFIYLFLFMGLMRLIVFAFCTNLGVPRPVVALVSLANYLACATIACPMPFHRVFPAGTGGTSAASPFELIRIGEYGIYYLLVPLLLPSSFLGPLPTEWPGGGGDGPPAKHSRSTLDTFSGALLGVGACLRSVLPRAVRPAHAIRFVSLAIVVLYLLFPWELRKPGLDAMAPNGHFPSPAVFENGRTAANSSPRPRSASTARRSSTRPRGSRTCATSAGCR